MTEIKSTIDLIMEKTKDFTLSDEEKQTIHNRELAGKVRGWLQRYIEGTIDISTIRSLIEQSGSDSEFYRKSLLDGALDLVNLDSDNNMILILLSDLLKKDTEPLAKLLDAFHKKWADELRVIYDKSLNILIEDGISGSAVHPNPASDRTLDAVSTRLNEEFRREMSSFRLQDL
jgi:hypothetical protein